MKPILVLDAYLDERGGAHNFERLLGKRAHVSVRTAFAPLPTSAADFGGVLISGSAASVLEPPAWLAPMRALLEDALREHVPVLGICFGHQVLAEAAFGVGAVRRAPNSELGWVEIARTGADPLLDVLPERLVCFSSHHDEVVENLEAMHVLARSERCAVQAYRVGDAPAWGVQFHPEMERAEADALVRSGLAAHVELDQDADAVLAAAVGTGELGRRLVERFLELANQPKRPVT